MPNKATIRHTEPPKFPTMLRKMWSGGEVQAWIDEHWPKPQPPRHAEILARLTACADDPMWADHAEVSKQTLEMAIEALTSDTAEALASRLISAWCASHDSQITLAKAIEISAIITGMDEAEKQRLLALD